MTTTLTLAEAAHAHANLATAPPIAADGQSGQSLTSGAAGIALLPIERARLGLGSWRSVHEWVVRATATQINASPTAGLYYGLPAITLILHNATADTDRYAVPLRRLDRHLTDLAHHRVDSAMERIGCGRTATFGEYDVFFGLTGIGAILLRRDPGGSALGRVLDYLVTLSRPQLLDGQPRPGWWVDHDPHRRDPTSKTDPAFADGHANLGLAHGIAGPLALLGHALRRGVAVDGHRQAIATITAWYEHWRQDGDAGPWWPEWVTTADLRCHRPTQAGPARPSWCYGTPGIARAGQVAAIATGDPDRQRWWEDALGHCLADPIQQAHIVDRSLCHGWAGLYQTTLRAARDAITPGLDEHLPRLAANLCGPPDLSAGPGLLTGIAGTGLALHAATHHTPPASDWDTCLLIN